MQRHLLVLLSLLAFVLRLVRLASVGHPLGTDGYYYVVQVESLLAHGRLHVPDASWVHPFLAVFGGLLRDPVLGVAAGGAALAAACVPAAWWLGRRLGGPAAAWVLAAWAAASPTLTQLAGDFPKNLGVAAPWLLLLALLAAPSGGGGRRGLRGLGLAAAALACASAHRTGAALLLLAGLGWGLGWLGARLGGGERPAGRAALRGVLVLVGCALLFALGSITLPAWLHPADLARLEGRFALEPHWPAPWGWLALRPTHGAQLLELSLPWVALLALLPTAFARPALRPWLGAVGLPLGVLLFPGWRLDELDLGYRLSLLGPLVAAPLLALVPRVLGPSVRAHGSLLVLAFLLQPLAWWGVDPASAPPYERYRAVLEGIPRPLPTLLIAHQGMSFYYDHLTGHEAMAWAPEPSLDRREVYRVVHGVRAGEWLAFLAPEVDTPRPLPLGHGYHYVREDGWEIFLERALAGGDPDLQARLEAWRNPRTVRPAHMLRGR